MYVYFLKAWGECPLIKIGKAKNPEMRVRELQVGCPFKLKLLGSVRCKSDLHAQQVERFAHRLFHKQRRRGEWFRLSKPQERAIRRIIERISKEEADTERAETAMTAMDAEVRAIAG